MPRTFALALLAAAAVTMLPAVPAQAGAPPAPPAAHHATATHRAVFELTTDQETAWGAILTNLENLTAHYGQANVQFEVVAHGPGIGIMLKANTALAPRMEALARRGIVFAACNNTMKRTQIATEALLPFVTVVPAGIAEVIDKQAAGWAYIKAGH